nr:MAG TPA: hypothetical protein [Bacteriophage sp.]
MIVSLERLLIDSRPFLCYIKYKIVKMEYPHNDLYDNSSHF